MEKIHELLDKVNGFVEQFLGPILDKIIQFLSSGKYLGIGIICFFAALLLLIGILAWIKKFPKFFFFMLLIFGGLAAAALLL